MCIRSRTEHSLYRVNTLLNFFHLEIYSGEIGSGHTIDVREFIGKGVIFSQGSIYWGVGGGGKPAPKSFPEKKLKAISNTDLI